MTERIQVSSDIWEWVKNTVTLSTLKDEIKDKIELWSQGEVQPTFNQLEGLSRDTRIPFGYFFLQMPPVESYPVLEYRTMNSMALDNPSRDLLDTITQMERIQDWMKDYLLDIGVQPLAYVGSLNYSDSVEDASCKIRKLLYVSDNWYSEIKSCDSAFSLMRTKISDVGALVMQNGVVGQNNHRQLDLNEFRAFTLIDELVPLIFLNAKDKSAPRLFSLLHEFVHICLGVGSLFNFPKWGLVDLTETFCNKVVAEILTPQKQFIEIWGINVKDAITNVDRVAKHFNCSHSVIARRAYDFNLINQTDYYQLQEFAKMLAENNKSNKVENKGGPGQLILMKSRLDSRFLSALSHTLKNGRTSYTEAVRLASVSRSTLDTYALELKGVR